MTAVVETFRFGFLGAGSFDPWQLTYSLGFTVVALFAGVLLFNRVEATFMDTV
jgi:lipopolysaccharide transport system permease protein